MAQADLSYRALPLRRLEETPAPFRTVILVLLVLGIAAFVTALTVDAPRAWRAYLSNWLFWTSIAQGAVILAAVLVIARGIWARAIRRFALAFVAFVPLALLLIIPPLLFAGDHLFPWIGLDMHGKEVWLNLPFIAVRTLVGLSALTILTLLFAYWQLRPELGPLREQAPARLQDLYARLTRGWRGDAEEAAVAHGKLSRLAPALILVYVVVFSMVSFDFVMSLDWHFWSTLIGGYFFWGALLGGVALTILVMIWARGRLGLESYIETAQIHDIGKMLFAFCIFWAYLFWSQFLVIWYGQLPWAQGFVVERFDAPFGQIALTVFFCLFVLPFFGLLGVRPKRTPSMLGTFALIVLLGLWLERYVLTYPSHYNGADALPLGWPEMGIGLAFAGLFLACFAWFATRFSLVHLWVSAQEKALLQTTAERPAEVVTEEYGEAD